MKKHVALFLVCVSAVACSPEPVASCPEGQAANTDGTCSAPPAPVGCQAGEVTRANGSCQKPGVPADGCAKGFKHDADVGCEPILPAVPCGAGQLAVPGESACHEVAACGAGAFPSVPSGGGGKVQYVDGSYKAGNSDGTQSKPWPTVQAAVDAAAAGDALAIAAGKYPEDVTLAKQLRVYG